MILYIIVEMVRKMPYISCLHEKEATLGIGAGINKRTHSFASINIFYNFA